MKANSSLSISAAAIGLLSVVAACQFSPRATDDGGGAAPTVLSSIPLDGAIDVALDGSVSATFSEEMDPATLTAITFTLTSGPAHLPVPGTVSYGGSTVVFRPATALASDAVFTATITSDATSASGVALAAGYAWSFTGDAVAAGPPVVNLGTAGAYAVLAKTGIKGITATVTGDLGVSPIAATAITGFSLIADASNTFSTSAQVTGKVYAASYMPPTPAALITAVLDMESASTDAAARPLDFNEVGAGNISGMTLSPGVYKWSTALSITTTATLVGGRKAVWIFQIGQDLTMSADARIVLVGGALPKNVFWQVTGAVTVAARAHLEGVVLATTAVTLAADVSVTGRLLAQTFTNIDGSTVAQPAP